MSYQQVPQGKDPQLWQLAHRRASFRSHLTIYLVMSIFFWLIWYFSGSRTYKSVPWPVWPMLGWGIGVAFHYIGAYVAPKSNATEREYNRLKAEQNSNTNI